MDWPASLLIFAGLICLLLLWWLWDTITSVVICAAVFLVSRLFGWFRAAKTETLKRHRHGDDGDGG